MARKKKTPESVTLTAELQAVVKMSALDLADPSQYLEARRLEYVQRIEAIADDAHNRGDFDLELKALAYNVRLTTLYKVRVDTASSNLGLVKAPDLSRLSDEEVQRLEHAGEEQLEKIATSIRKEDLN